MKEAASAETCRIARAFQTLYHYWSITKEPRR
jgi:hypothetical protein